MPERPSRKPNGSETTSRAEKDRHATLRNIQQRLQVRLAALEKQLPTLRIVAGGTQADFLDEAKKHGDRDVEIGLLCLLSTERQQIREAMERIQEGTFGICDACNKPISPRRLLALPYAVRCVGCQRKAEQSVIGAYPLENRFLEGAVHSEDDVEKDPTEWEDVQQKM